MTFEEIKHKLSSKTVGIAGAGGLGSNCAAALVRCGVGTIVIADFDVVDATNLNRQFYFFDQIGRKKTDAIKENLLRINPAVQVVTHDLKIDANNLIEVFKDCAVIVEAFDLAAMKQILIETVLVEMPTKYLVVGMGIAGFGDSNSIKMRSIGNKFFICGDEISEVSENNPPIAPRVGIVANMQANTVLELLLGKTESDIKHDNFLEEENL